MELRHLRYFVAVAEEESIARAAVRLHVSEPPLSRQVRDLEAELGAALLERGPRSVRLTEAGVRFLPEARAVLARAGRAAAAVRGGVKPFPASTVRIGLLGPGHVPYLRKLLARARLAWPGTKFHFESANPTALTERLEKSALDVICLDLPFPPGAQRRVDRGEWRSRQAYTAPLVAVVPAGHPLAAGRPVALADLAHEEFVLPARTGQASLGDRVLAACRQAGFEPQVGRWVEGPFSGVVAAVATGAGVSVVSAALRCVRLPGAVFRPLAPPVPRISFALVWPASALPVEEWLGSFSKGKPLA